VGDQASHLAEYAHPSKLRKLEDGTSVLVMGNSSHASYAAPPQAVGPSGPSGSYSAGAASFQRPGNEAQVQTIYNQFLSIYYVSTCLGLTFQYGRLVAVEIFDQSKHVLIFWS